MFYYFSKQKTTSVICNPALSHSCAPLIRPDEEQNVCNVTLGLFHWSGFSDSVGRDAILHIVTFHVSMSRGLTMKINSNALNTFIHNLQKNPRA